MMITTLQYRVRSSSYKTRNDIIINNDEKSEARGNQLDEDGRTNSTCTNDLGGKP